jgi:transcriptional regulator with XRE-family HTH domain
MTERELLKVLSGNIKQYRTLFKWSQAELAEKINISINFLSDIETGKKWASPNTMVKLADVFRIEAYELLKPANLLPDKSGKVIQKYTEDIFVAVNKIRDTYVDKLG